MAGAGAETAGLAQENRKILIVSREVRFSESVVNYAVNLAERLGYDLIALNVGPGWESKGFLHSPYSHFLGEKFKLRSRKAAAQLERRLRAKGLGFEHLVRFGEVGTAVETLNHEKSGLNLCLMPRK